MLSAVNCNMLDCLMHTCWQKALHACFWSAVAYVCAAESTWEAVDDSSIVLLLLSMCP